MFCNWEWRIGSFEGRKVWSTKGKYGLVVLICSQAFDCVCIGWKSRSIRCYIWCNVLLSHTLRRTLLLICTDHRWGDIHWHNWGTFLHVRWDILVRLRGSVLLKVSCIFLWLVHTLNKGLVTFEAGGALVCILIDLASLNIVGSDADIVVVGDKLVWALCGEVDLFMQCECE